MPTILVVDDEPIRKLLRTALEQARYAVIEAQNGRVGLALYRTRVIIETWAEYRKQTSEEVVVSAIM